ncbi:hypothetical protein ACHQM5_005827 [Ranunculus cassubicifolius]
METLIDLVLKNVGDKKPINAIIKKAQKVTKYFYNHGRALQMMRDAIGGDLVRTGLDDNVPVMDTADEHITNVEASNRNFELGEPSVARKGARRRNVRFAVSEETNASLDETQTQPQTQTQTQNVSLDDDADGATLSQIVRSHKKSRRKGRKVGGETEDQPFFKFTENDNTQDTVTTPAGGYTSTARTTQSSMGGTSTSMGGTSDRTLGSDSTSSPPSDECPGRGKKTKPLSELPGNDSESTRSGYNGDGHQMEDEGEDELISPVHRRGKTKGKHNHNNQLHRLRDAPLESQCSNNIIPCQSQQNNFLLGSNNFSVVDWNRTPAFPVSQTNKSLKQQREDHKEESETKGDTRAWNSLFMRSDTIVENAARKYGTSKSDFLDREADDLAVKIALAETQVIADTKKALANSGVNVAALEEFISGKSDAGKRSNHVVLVKNLPYGSSEGDLAKMFGKFGSIDKIILPPTKTLAFVVFLEAAEARGAFKGLAYKRYKDVPLYLEWAPNNIFSPTSKSENEAVIDQQDVKRGVLEHHAEEITNDQFDPDRVESRTLVLKNLNFKTSDEGLRKHFSDLMKEGNINSVTIRKHLHHGKTVSRGFGFIEFDSADTAANVLNDLQGTILDGHKLTLQVSQAKKDGQVTKKTDMDKSSTKLIVFNVAFGATKKDLRDLFGSFGQIKSLRLPMKFGNHPQGFAFVEFMTKKEAQHALEALSNTHLYGRHLVLEWAKEGESLEDLRARTAAQFTDEQNGYQNPAKVSKKRKRMGVDEGMH